MTLAKLQLLFIVLCVIARPSVAAQPATQSRTPVTFTEQSPHSRIPEILSRTEVEFFDEFDRKHIRPEALQEIFDRQKAAWVYSLAKEPFDVVVPASAGNDPQGLFVWLGGCDVSDAWLDALARQNLIYVAARSGGNHVSIVREALALDAVHNMTRRYQIDPNRIYIAGFGSGAQIAAWMVRAWPDVFSGGYFLMGGWFYKADIGFTDWFFAPKFERDGRFYPDADTMAPAWKSSAAWPLDKIKSEKKLVLLRGAKDDTFVTADTPPDDRLQFNGLHLDGFARAAYIEVPALGHAPPPTEFFEQGLIALEAKPHSTPATAPTTGTPESAQSEQARRMLISAMHGGTDDRVRRLLTQIIDDYPTTDSVALARKGLSKLFGAAKSRPAPAP